jgi:hypothetical protein
MTQDWNVLGRRALLKCLFAAALWAAPLSLSAAAQTPRATPKGQAAGQKSPTPAKPAAQPLVVRMSKEAPHTFTVKAKEARLTDVAGEFARLLKVPVTLSPLLQKQQVSLDFSGMNLEGALRLLAPQAYVDYVAGGEEAQPVPLAVYLQGLNEQPPALTATVRGNSEAILIEGDTEEGVGEEEEKKKEEENPLRVTFAQNQLSVLARKQPLTVVLFRIASEIGVPFELRWETPQMVDVEFTNYSIEQAVRTLSPAVRLYYRIDLQSFNVQPLRLALVAPTPDRS